MNDDLTTPTNEQHKIIMEMEMRTLNYRIRALNAAASVLTTTGPAGIGGRGQQTAPASAREVIVLADWLLDEGTVDDADEPDTELNESDH